MFRLLILPALAFLKAHFAHLVFASLWDRPYGPLTGAANSAAMTGLNVQAQGAPVLPLQQSFTTNAETAVANPQNPSQFLFIELPPNLPSAEQTPLDISFSGYVKTMANGNITLIVREGNNAALGNNTQIATSGAIAVNTTTVPFFLQLRVCFDSVSGKLIGYFDGSLGNSLIARAALSNIVSGIANSASPVLQLILTLTSSGAAGATPTLLNLNKASIG